MAKMAQSARTNDADFMVMLLRQTSDLLQDTRCDELLKLGHNRVWCSAAAYQHTQLHVEGHCVISQIGT